MSDQLQGMHEQIEKLFRFGVVVDHINADVLHRYIDEQQARIEELEGVLREVKDYLIDIYGENKCDCDESVGITSCIVCMVLGALGESE